VNRTASGKSVRSNSRTPPGRRAAAKDGVNRRYAAAPALEHLCFAIGKAYYAYLGTLEIVLQQSGLDRHLHPGAGYILFTLFERDHQTIKELVTRAELSYPTVSGIVARLKRAKLVACRRTRGDARSVRVSLTPLGKSLQPQCRAALARIDRIMLDGISGDSLSTSQQAIRQMIDALRRFQADHAAEKSTKARGRSRAAPQ
jgi:DNA-binding MarR family transcriptional regulator